MTKSKQDRRNFLKTSAAAALFLDGFSSYRKRPVRAIQELLSNLRPMLAAVLGKLSQRHPVDAWGTSVAAYLFPSPLEIVRIQHLLHQIF